MMDWDVPGRLMPAKSVNNNNNNRPGSDTFKRLRRPRTPRCASPSTGALLVNRHEARTRDGRAQARVKNSQNGQTSHRVVQEEEDAVVAMAADNTLLQQVEARMRE